MMRNMISHGTGDQMLDAFKHKLSALQSSASDVESATDIKAGKYANLYGLSDVKKYLNGKKYFYGSEIEMDFGDGLKLANYLKKQGKEVNYCPSQETWSIPGECHWGDCYFYPYEANLDGCDDDGPWDGKSSPRDVESSTVVQSAVQKSKNVTRGSADQMLAAFEAKVAELEGDVSASSTIKAADEVEDIVDYLAPEDEERYIHTLIGDVNTELEDLDIFDSWTWEYSDSDLVLTTVKDSEVEEYTVPRDDLKFDWDRMEEDVQYIVRAITNPEEDEFAEDVTSATVIESSEDDKSVVIPDYAKTEYYSDYEGGFGGDKNDIYSLEDIMIMWNSDHNNDPVMSEYESFNEWWKDTKRWMRPSSKPEEGNDDEMFTDHDGIFGNPGDVISKNDMRDYWEDHQDSDPSLSDFNSFEDWWGATAAMLQPIDSATALYQNSYDELVSSSHSNRGRKVQGAYDEDDDFYYEDEESIYTEIASKSVPDSDGFYTDYTMYRNTETGEYVFVFGDKEIYTPDQEDFDWTCDTESEAWEWFNDYTGFEEEERERNGGGYSPDLLQELVNQYSSMDAFSGYMTLDEIWEEIVNQYSDEDLANDVLEALDGSDGVYSAEELDADESTLISWFTDSNSDVIDADWGQDNQIIVTLNHNTQDIDATAADLISCIESNRYHVIDWNVNGQNVFIFEVIESDMYEELSVDDEEI